MASTIAFVTFGMFIIDEIEYINGQQSQQNLIGGAGVYAALGARLAAGRENARCVSWIVDIGSDFPSDITDQIDSWNTNCVFRVDNTRLTTRAWNGYGPNEFRSFKYLTPKIRLEVKSLNDDQVLSSSFHMVCSPARCMELSNNLKERRNTIDPTTANPVVVWEPIPDLCTPEELQNVQRAAEEVSVVSPNADELASFFAQTPSQGQDQDEMVKQFMGWNEGRALSTHAIIREGAHGSTVYIAPKLDADDHGGLQARLRKVHLPAFHLKTDALQVVDPTGGGNTYLGGLAIGMTDILYNDPITAMIREKIPTLKNNNSSGSSVHRVIIGALYAVIAASYAIEQCGVPTLSTGTTDSVDGSEQWSGQAFADRMKVYLEREAHIISRQLIQNSGNRPPSK